MNRVLVSGATGNIGRQVVSFRGKPGDRLRRATQIAPHHLRLDWLDMVSCDGLSGESSVVYGIAGKAGSASSDRING